MGEGVIGGSVIGEGVIGGSGYRWVVDAAVGLELMVSGRGDVLNAIVRLVGCTVPLEEGAIELAGIWLEVCSVLCKITDGGGVVIIPELVEVWPGLATVLELLELLEAVIRWSCPELVGVATGCVEVGCEGLTGFVG